MAYPLNDARGLGAIGHNHAYTAVQIILLVALVMSLAKRNKPFTGAFFILLGLAACFASESRAGLAAMVLFALAILLRNPIYVPVAAVLIFLASLFASPDQLDTADIRETLERSQAVLDPSQASQFRARLTIWEFWMDEFRQQPSMLVTGAGFGASRNFLQVPHMLYLTVLVEFGILGLVVYLAFAYGVVQKIRRAESKPKPFFWATLAMLFAALTQETFYPVVATGHFIGLFLCAVAILLRVSQNEELSRQSALGSQHLAYPAPGGATGYVPLVSQAGVKR
jgi:O-antigen ligase